MDFLLWTERYRKKTNYGFYIPEYVVVCKIQNGTVRDKLDLRIKMPIQPGAVEDDLQKAFGTIINLIKANTGCTVVYVSERDVKIFHRVFQAHKMLRFIGKEYILNPDEYKIITNGKPATNANCRRSHASKAITSYISGRFRSLDNNEIKIGDNKKSDNLDYDTESNINYIDTEIDNTEESAVSSITYVRIGNSNIYHKSDCRMINKKKSNIREVSIDEISNMRPCNLCLHDKVPTITDDNKLDDCTNADIPNDSTTVTSIESESTIEANNDKLPNRADKCIEYKGIDPLGNSLVDLCSKYGIYCEVLDKVIVLLTAAGGWKFDYTERPIQLYHQNYKHVGTAIANIEYHIQKGEFMAPIDAIAYIISHDNKRIKLELNKVLNI